MVRSCLKNPFCSRTLVTTFYVVLSITPQYETEQIGIRCSGTRKCSQKYEIDHFCRGIFSANQLSKIIQKYLLNYLLKYLSFVFELHVGMHLEILFEKVTCRINFAAS